jgi:hypothetical protein
MTIFALNFGQNINISLTPSLLCLYIKFSYFLSLTIEMFLIQLLLKKPLVFFRQLRDSIDERIEL